MFGMHIGSVLSGLDIINVNTDLKMLSLPVFLGRKWVSLGGSKMRVFSMFGGLGGDFYMRQSCLGCMVEGFVCCGQVIVPNRFG